MNIAQHTLLLAVRLYRWVLSPAKQFVLGPAARCRFTPSCSEYALEAVQRHGAARGTLLAAGRLCRCHPWGGSGPDPVPWNLPVLNCKLRDREWLSKNISTFAGSNTLFPLTPALSLGERGAPRPVHDACEVPPLSSDGVTMLSLRWGEGRGEGERDSRPGAHASIRRLPLVIARMRWKAPHNAIVSTIARI